MLDYIKLIAWEENYRLPNCYYTINELNKFKKYTYSVNDIKILFNFLKSNIEFKSDESIYVFQNSELDFLYTRSLKYYLFNYDYSKKINPFEIIENSYLDILNNIDFKVFFEKYTDLFFVVNYEEIIKDLSFFDDLIVNQLVVILDYLSNNLPFNEFYNDKSNSNLLNSLELFSDNNFKIMSYDINNFELYYNEFYYPEKCYKEQLLDFEVFRQKVFFSKIDLIFRKNKVQELIDLLLGSAFVTNETFILKHVNSKNIFGILNSSKLKREAEKFNKILSKIDLKIYLDISYDEHIIECKIPDLILKNIFEIKGKNVFKNFKIENISDKTLSYLFENFELVDMMLFDLREVLLLNKELENQILNVKYILFTYSDYNFTGNFILIFNKNFNYLISNSFDYFKLNLSNIYNIFDHYRYFEKAIDYPILFENLLILEKLNITEFEYLKISNLLKNNSSDSSFIDFTNTDPYLLINLNLDIDWNLVLKNKTFKYDSHFIENNLDFFCDQQNKVLLTSLNIPVFSTNKKIDFNSEYYFDEYLYYCKRLSEINYNLLQDKKNISMNENRILDSVNFYDNLICFLKDSVIYDDYYGVLQYSSDDFCLFYFDNHFIKIKNIKSDTVLSFPRFVHNDEQQKSIDNHIIENIYSDLFNYDFDYHDLEKLKEFDLIKNNLNIFNKGIFNIIQSYSDK